MEHNDWNTAMHIAYNYYLLRKKYTEEEIEKYVREMYNESIENGYFKNLLKKETKMRKNGDWQRLCSDIPYPSKLNDRALIVNLLKSELFKLCKQIISNKDYLCKLPEAPYSEPTTYYQGSEQLFSFAAILEECCRELSTAEDDVLNAIEADAILDFHFKKAMSELEETGILNNEQKHNYKYHISKTRSKIISNKLYEDYLACFKSEVPINNAKGRKRNEDIVDLIAKLLCLTDSHLRPALVFCVMMSPELACDIISGQKAGNWASLIYYVASNCYKNEMYEEGRNSYTFSQRKVVPAAGRNDEAKILEQRIKFMINIVKELSFSSENRAYTFILNIYAINRVTGIFEPYFAAENSTQWSFMLPDMFFAKTLPVCRVEEFDPEISNVLFIIREAMKQILNCLEETEKEGNDVACAAYFKMTSGNLSAMVETAKKRIQKISKNIGDGKLIAKKELYNGGKATMSAHYFYTNDYNNKAQQTLQALW